MRISCVPVSEHRPHAAWLILPALVGALALGASVCVGDEVDEGARWQTLKSVLFADRPIQENDGVIALKTPYRVEDAAVVPIEISTSLVQTPERHIKTLSLIIDNNPAPVAGVFHFPGNRPWSELSTRVRIDRYTHVRAIAETNDGQLHMAANFVKAAGGCSAPASKDPAAAEAQLGRMKLRTPDSVSAGKPLAMQLLIRHPNSSGLQFDQIARAYIPPNYIQALEVGYGDRPLFELDGNISISEDPSVSLTFVPPSVGPVTVSVKDSKGRVFNERFDVPAND
jgi:sulfur-oxidizing protein SoxY